MSYFINIFTIILTNFVLFIIRKEICSKIKQKYQIKIISQKSSDEITKQNKRIYNHEDVYKEEGENDSG